MAEQRIFIDRIRAALGNSGTQQATWAELFPPTNDRPILHTLANRSRAEIEALLTQLQHNAVPLNLQLHACGSLREAADCIATIAIATEPEFGTTREIVLHDHPLLQDLQIEERLRGAAITTHWTRNGDVAVHQHTKNSYIGITVADWGIADSATIVQLTRPGRPRSTSLVPSIHIALLPLEKLVADLAQAYALIRQEQDLDSMVLISGPSKTADIEACMVHGAHGPKAMHLVVLTAGQ
jgi:L-lactate dehydrogenase complex protein LldG